MKAKHHLTGLPKQMNINLMIAEVDAAIAAQDGRVNDHHIETYWKSASGFIHGRQWATLNLLVREEVTPLGNATATVKLASTPSRILWGTAAAYEMIDRSLALYYAACGTTPRSGATPNPPCDSENERHRGIERTLCRDDLDDERKEQLG